MAGRLSCHVVARLFGHRQIRAKDFCTSVAMTQKDLQLPGDVAKDSGRDAIKKQGTQLVMSSVIETSFTLASKARIQRKRFLHFGRNDRRDCDTYGIRPIAITPCDRERCGN